MGDYDLIGELKERLTPLESMKNYPKELYFLGNRELLERPKLSIVGSRRPLSYTKQFTHKLAKALASRGVVIVSGVAMGVDAIAHKGAGAENSIAVMANGLDIRYPAVNRTLILEIEQKGLALSQFPIGFKPTPWSMWCEMRLWVSFWGG